MTSKNDSPSPKPKTQRYGMRRIVCVETGEVYESAEAAAQALGVTYGGANIRNAALDGGMSKGYHWRFQDMPEAKPGEVRGNRAVVCWETDETFETAEAAAKWAGCDPKAIYSAVRLRNAGGGYHWYLKGKPKPDASALKFSRRVVCWETGEAFESVSAAATSIGKNDTSIRRAIDLRRPSGGYHWYFQDEPRPDESLLGTPKESSATKQRAKRSVVCWETGEVFENIDAAAAFAGVDRSRIHHATKNGRTAGGHHWYWADQPKPESFDKPKKEPKKRPERAVVCWETKVARFVGLP